jgi:hypothetical protein
LDVNTVDLNSTFEPREIMREVLGAVVSAGYPRCCGEEEAESVRKYDPQDYKNPGQAVTSFESNNAILHDPAFHAITQTGFDGWFHDEIFDTGFHILERLFDCSTHRIALSNVIWATSLFQAGHLCAAKSQNSELSESWEDITFDFDAVDNSQLIKTSSPSR